MKYRAAGLILASLPQFSFALEYVVHVGTDNKHTENPFNTNDGPSTNRVDLKATPI